MPAEQYSLTSRTQMRSHSVLQQYGSLVHTSSAQVLHDSVSFAPGLQTACEHVPPPPPPLLDPLLEPELLPLLEPELLPLLEPELLPLLDPELLPLLDPLLEPELLPLLDPLLDPELLPLELLLEPPDSAAPLGEPQPVGPS